MVPSPRAMRGPSRTPLPMCLDAAHSLCVCWIRELLLDVKSQLRRRRLSDVLFYLVLGTVIASMVALNLPEPAARSRNVPPPGGGGGRQTGWDDASAAGGGANEKEYYDLLGLPPGASWDDIKRAYRALSLEWYASPCRIHCLSVFRLLTD